MPLPVSSYRKVTNIAASIPQGHFLVYAFTTRDHIRCDRDGKFLNGTNEAGYLFQSVEAACAYAKAEAERSAAIGFGVQNSAYGIVAQYVGSACARQRAKSQTPSRLLFWSSVMLASGGLLLWIEARSGWTLMFGFLAGSRLLFSGCLKAGSAIYRLNHQRTQKTKETVAGSARRS